MASTPTTSDERILSAVAHFSVLLFGWGIFLPMIVWVLERKKSAFARFQALQAAVYTIAIFVLYLLVVPLLVLVLTLVMVVVAALTASSAGDAGAGLVLGFQFLLFGFIFGVWGVFILTGVIGGIACLMGRDFRYPLLGSWMDRFLHQPEPAEAAE